MAATIEMHLSMINVSKGWTVKDVAASDFIAAFASHLKKSGKFKIPEWAQYSKTACYKELAPYNPDWLYVRAAAVARQVYMRRHIGVQALRDHFGDKERRGVKSEHHRRAAGRLIRYCLKQLSDMGLVGIIKEEGDEKSARSYGRLVTKKGMQDMDRIATSVMAEKGGNTAAKKKK